MSFEVGLETLRTLGLVLDSEEIGVYIAVKCFIGANNKNPSRAYLDELMPGSVKIVKKLQKRSLLEKGSIKLDKIDALLRNAIANKTRIRASAPEDLTSDRAKVLVLLLREKLISSGLELPDSWWAKNRSVAQKWLKEGVAFEMIQKCIEWIFSDNPFAAKYLRSNCLSMYKVKDYFLRFQAQMKEAKQQEQYSHEELFSLQGVA